jgi:hypothetical protein
MTFSRDIQVGRRRAVMTLDATTGELCVAWSHMPDADELTASDLAAYYAARNRLVHEYAAALARNDRVLQPYCKATWEG